MLYLKFKFYHYFLVKYNDDIDWYWLFLSKNNGIILKKLNLYIWNLLNIKK